MPNIEQDRCDVCTQENIVFYTFGSVICVEKFGDDNGRKLDDFGLDAGWREITVVCSHLSPASASSAPSTTSKIRCTHRGCLCRVPHAPFLCWCNAQNESVHLDLNDRVCAALCCLFALQTFTSLCHIKGFYNGRTNPRWNKFGSVCERVSFFFVVFVFMLQQRMEAIRVRILYDLIR